MKRNILFVAVVFIAIVFLYILSQIVYSPFNNYNRLKALIGNKNYSLYLATTEKQKQLGLSNIKFMSAHEGMLFEFDESNRHGFWMKEMRFPLDFIFVNNGQIVDLLENILPSTYPQIFHGKTAYNAVIELNAGEIKKNNAKLGDNIDMKRAWEDSNHRPTP